MNKLFLIVVIAALSVGYASCSDSGSTTENQTQSNVPKTQADIDKELIEKYVKEHNLDAQVTPSGIYYVIEKEGDGTHPNITNQVTVHYKGTLLDGTKFDASYDRGEPTTFPLGGVVKGWQEGIPLLSKGGKGKLIIPSELAYGPQSPTPAIPPNSVLVFEVELLDIARSQADVDKEIIEAYVKEKNLDTKITPSGIHYIITKEGDGTHPSINNTVVCHYNGTLLDGTKFDSSYDRGQPATFPLTNVIRGWQEGIPLLSKGGKATLIIPSGLAYGPMQRSEVIKANSILIFDVELVDIK